MAACEPERMGKHMAAYAWGRQPWCMSAAAYAPATCEHRCAQACALPKCMPRTANVCGSCRRTGSRMHRGTPRPRAGQRRTPPHRRQHAHADAWGGKPAAESTAAREKQLGTKAGKGKHERRWVGGRCWHLGTSADEHAGTCRCACSQCPPQRVWGASPRLGACTTLPRHRSQTRLHHLLFFPLLSTMPSPAQHHRRGAGPASGAGSTASHHHSLAMTLSSGAGHECCSLLPSQCQPPSGLHSLGPPLTFKAKAQR